MDASVSCFVSGTLAVVLRVLRLAGAAPLRFQKHGDGWRISLAPRLSKIACFILGILSLGFIARIISELQAHKSDNVQFTTWAITLTVESLTEMVLMMTMVYGAPGRMRCMMACLNQVQMINSKLNIHQWPPQWKCKQITLFVFWMITNVLAAIIKYVFLLRFELSTKKLWVQVMYFLYFIYFWINELVIIQFMVLVMRVQSSFKAINECLSKLQQDNITNSNTHYETVRRIASAYVSACNVVRDVNSSHGLMMTMFIAVIFMHLVISPYYFIINMIFTTNRTLSSPLLILRELLQLFWCAFHITNLMMIIEPCHLTHMEMERTRELVGNLLLTRRPQAIFDPLVIELEHFCCYLALNDVSYKPLHVFKVTRGLALTILGSITTYLVVLTEIK